MLSQGQNGVYAMNMCLNAVEKGFESTEKNRYTDSPSVKRFNEWDKQISHYLSEYKHGEKINKLLSDNTSISDTQQTFLNIIKEKISQQNTNVYHADAHNVKRIIDSLANLYTTKKELFKDASANELKECSEKISFYTKNFKNNNNNSSLNNFLSHVSLLKSKIDALKKNQHTFVNSDEIQFIIRDIINNVSINNNEELKRIKQEYLF